MQLQLPVLFELNEAVYLFLIIRLVHFVSFFVTLFYGSLSSRPSLKPVSGILADHAVFQIVETLIGAILNTWLHR